MIIKQQKNIEIYNSKLFKLNNKHKKHNKLNKHNINKNNLQNNNKKQ